MTQNKPVALVLGGIVPHIRLIDLLKERGYHTVLIDYYDNPPAKEFADEHLCESTLDIEKVYEIAVERNAALVIGLCVDQANVTSSYVSEKLGLPMLYSYESALAVTDKSSMKRIMKESGVPTSDYIITKTPEAAAEGLRYPLVVKPVDNNGSKGVQKVEDPNALAGAIGTALSLSRKGEAVIEEFNRGFEIQVDCFVHEGEAEVLMVKKRFKIPQKSGNALQSFGSVTPVEMSDLLRSRIREAAVNIAKGFKLRNTPFFMQAIVDGDDLRVLEFAPRIGGTTSFVMIEMATGFDMIGNSLKALLGEPVPKDHHEPERFISTVIMYAYEGTFSHVSGYEKLLEDGVIDRMYISMTEGMKTGKMMDSKNRVGSFMASAATKEELADKIGKAMDEIDVIGTDGSSMMRKDLRPVLEMM